MAKPTLSVIVPNYNHAEYLRAALGAILEQSWRPQEIIVVDDGSRDNSVEIVAGIARRNPLVRLVQNGRNRGVAYTHNRGLGLAAGEYVYFAGADDRVLPGFFERAMGLAEEYPQAGIIFGKFAMVDPQGKIIAIFEACSWRNQGFATPERFLHEYLQVESASHSMCAATVYRRCCLVEVGGFRDHLGHWTDTFAARAIALKDGACYLPEMCMYWRHVDASVAHSTSTARLIRIATAAAGLMRSPELRERFPDWYVESWLQGYYDAVIDRHVVQAEHQIQAANRQRRDRLMMPLHWLKVCAGKILPGLHRIKFGKVIDPVIRFLGDAWCGARLSYTKWRLRCHQGHTSR